MSDYSELLSAALASNNPRGEMLKIETALEEELKKILEFIAQRFFSFPSFGLTESSSLIEMLLLSTDVVGRSAEMTIC